MIFFHHHDLLHLAWLPTLLLVSLSVVVVEGAPVRTLKTPLIEGPNNDAHLDAGANQLPPPLKRKNGIIKGRTERDKFDKAFHYPTTGDFDSEKHLTMDRNPRKISTLTRAILTSLPDEHDPNEMFDLEGISPQLKNAHNAHHTLSSNHINRGVSVTSQREAPPLPPRGPRRAPSGGQSRSLNEENEHPIPPPLPPRRAQVV